MSKMGKLYLESEREEIAFNNSQYDQEKKFLRLYHKRCINFYG